MSKINNLTDCWTPERPTGSLRFSAECPIASPSAEGSSLKLGEPASISSARAAIAAAFDSDRRVFLGFSGGKDSLTLLHLCEPWSDRLTLLWVNTGYMAPHMVDFVREHVERYRLVELAPERPMLDQWREHGPPADIIPMEHLSGATRRHPPLQPWMMCCGVHRNTPAEEFLARTDEPCVLLNGQREVDKAATPAGLQSIMSPNVTVSLPLWECSTAEVLNYVAAHGIILPSHHGVCGDSIECIICPADLTVQRMRVLDDLYPDAAAFVRETAAENLALATAAIARITATIAPRRVGKS